MNDQWRIIDNTEQDESPVPLEHFRRPAIQDKRELVITVYQDVWNEFYSWEEGDCATAIASLARPFKRRPPNNHLEALNVGNSIDADASSSFLVSEYDDTGSEIGSSRIFCVKIPFKASIEPHPPYQVCVPISRNIFWRDGDPDDQTSVPFIPYADEERFDAIEYLKQFSGQLVLEWQTSMIDPDHEMIELEAIRRLRFVHKLSSPDIDHEKVFSDKVYRTNEVGIVWSCSQRDKLTWPGSSLAPYPELEELDIPETWNIQARLSSVVRTFCPNLNCVQSHCSVHVHNHPDSKPPKPKKTNSSLRLIEGGDCNRDCFRNADDDFVDKIPITPEDQTSKAVINLFPDLLPCDLAVLCRKPCREVYALRCSLFPDHKITATQDESGYEEQIPLDNAFFVDNYRPDGTPPFVPLKHMCDHRGPCAKGVCPCYDHNVHCQRNCACESNCVLRWNGCKCKVKSRNHKATYTPCGKRCPCRLSNRECDPDLCKSCEASNVIQVSDPKNKGRCSNVLIQCARPAVLEIKRGLIGLGAFATHKIQQGDYVGEYVGESYRDEGDFDDEKINEQSEGGATEGGATEGRGGEVGGDGFGAVIKEQAQALTSEREIEDPRGYVRRYKSLNYLFTLNKNKSLDADRVGNETRYLNHRKESNVVAKVLLVNNEHRLGFFATKTIAKGRELFLDYGELYWVGGDEPKEC